MAAPRGPRPMPVLADGSTPSPEQRVVTFDGHPAVILWTTERMIIGDDGKKREAPRTDPEFWQTLVRLDDTGRTHRYATCTLKPRS